MLKCCEIQKKIVKNVEKFDEDLFKIENISRKQNVLKNVIENIINYFNDLLVLRKIWLSCAFRT